MSQRARRILALLAVFAAEGVAQIPSIGNYVMQSETRIDRTIFEVVYKANLTNPGAIALTHASATVASTNAAVTIVENGLEFGAVGANTTKTSIDTFTIRHNRTVPFQPSFLQWTITLNRAPTANAGPDQSITTGQTVQLTGAGSSDPDGNALSYSWTLIAKPSGSAAALINAGAVNPSFVADRFGSYTARLVVHDGLVNSAPDDVVISTQNSPPVANAGPDQSLPVGSLVTLNGTASSDVDGQPLTYAWTMSQKPAGSTAALNNPAAAMPTFTIDRAGTYRVQLVVSDGIAQSAADEVVVTTSNTAPVANAGPDQSVYVTQTVTLNGSLSSDVDGNPLTYSWSLTSKPAGSAAALTNPTGISPTFVADRFGTYVAQLIVNDGFVNSAPDTVQITTLNTAPVANAGPDQTVVYLATVNLNGSASSDVDGNALTYAWSLTTRPVGSTAALNNATAVNPTFVADRPGTFVAQLIVHDGTVNSAPDTVTITTNNSAPVANAGPDVSVNVGSLVTLNGAGSSDPDGNPLTYAWSLTSKPNGSTAALSNATIVNPTFTVDLVGSYVAQLIVSDGILSSAPDTVVISTNNLAPTANAGPDQTVNVNTTVQLTGLASTDPEGSPLTYSWSLTAKPAGSAAALNNLLSSTPSFLADLVGTYVAQLIVSDGQLSSAPDTVQITVANRPPVANAGPDQTVLTNTVVNLSGASSSDPDGHPLTYSWTLLVKPAGSASALSSTTSAATSFTPDLAGSYTARLVVNDGFVNSAADDVVITANPPPPLTLPATVAINLTQTPAITVTLPAPAPAGGVVVTVGSSAPTVVGVATPTVNIAAGNTTGGITLQGLNLGSATITASAPGYSNATSTATVSAVLNITNTSLTFTPGFPGTLNVRLEVAGNPVNAPAGGVPFALTAADATCVANIASASIPAGQNNVNLTVNHGGGATLPCTTTTTAAGTNLTQDQLSVTVNPNQPIAMLSFPTTIGSNLQGGPFIARLPISSHGGRTVTITSPDPALVTVSSSSATAGGATVNLNVADGSTDATFYLHALTGTGAPVITASATGFSNGTGTANIVQPAVLITGLPASITVSAADLAITAQVGVPNGGNTALAQVQPVRAGGQLTVTFTNQTSTVARLTNTAGTGQTRTAIVAAGQTQTPGSVASGGVAFDPLLPGGTSVLAAIAGFTSIPASPGFAVTVTGGTISTGSYTLGAGLVTQGFAGLSGSAHGGVTAHVESTNPAKVLVSANVNTPGATSFDVFIPNGNTQITFALHGMENQTGAVAVTITAPDFAEAAANVTVEQPVVEITGLSTSQTAQGANSPFQVRTTVGNIAEQSVRPGSAGVTVTVANSVAATAQLVNAQGSGQTRTSTIAAGASRTTDLQFDPIAGGTTTVSVTAPGFGTNAQSSVLVSVTASAITMQQGTRIGVGLMREVYGGMGGAVNGATQVLIQSNDATKLLVSATCSPASPVGSSVTLTVPDQQSNFNFCAHGIAAGTPTVTASSAGFTSATEGVGIVAPTAQIVGWLPASLSTLSANYPVLTRVGIPNVGNSYFESIQQVRTGTTLTLTITNSNAAAARLQVGATTGQSVSLPIAEGSTGDYFELDALAAGTTTVTATGPGFVAIAGVNSGSVEITAPGISGVPVAMASGLMTTTYANLGGGEHGGVTVRVQSPNPALVLVSANQNIAGSAFVDIPVPNGQTQFNFAVHALEGVTGVANLSLSAPGFTSGTVAVTVEQGAVQIIGFSPTMSIVSANQALVAQVGSASGGSFYVAMPARTGGPGVTVTLTSSNTGVGKLITTAVPGGGGLVTVVVPPGAIYSPFDIPSGGAEFDAVGVGTTTVTAAAPGFLTAASTGSQVVTVSPASIMAFGENSLVGAGLMYQCCSAILSGGAHGGVTATVTSLDPSRVLVSPDQTTVGAANFTFPVANGQTNIPLVIHGVNGATPGSVTIQISAPGFTSTTITVSLVAPALSYTGFSGLPVPVGSPDAVMVINTGVPDISNGYIQIGQQVRFGGPSLTVTVQSSNAAVGSIVVGGTAAASRTVTIAPGNGQSYDASFRPVAPGTTTVSVSAPGFVTTNPGGSQMVQVVP